MKTLISFAVVALTTFALQAQAASPNLSAGDVYFDCLLGKSGAKDRGILCGSAIWGFSRGFVAGSDRGAAIALTNDQKASQTVAGMKDLWPRLTAIKIVARCIPKEADIGVLIESYTNYMKAHPERNEEDFPAVMEDIVLSSCGGRN